MMLSRFMPAGMRRNSAHISRIAAAVLGGYLLANALSVLVAFLLPMPHAESVATVLLLSFVTLSLVVIWVYATSSLKKVWTVIGLGLVISVVGSTAFHLLGAA